MNIIKQLIENHGYVTSSDLIVLEKEFPNLQLVIKWGCSPRTIHPAKDVKKVIENAMKVDSREYAREVFLSANQLDAMKAALGTSF